MSDEKNLPPGVANQLANARNLLARAKTFVAGLSRSTKVLIASTIVASALLFGILGLRSFNEPYAPLFTNLDREDAAALVAKLKEKKIPYKLQGDGSTIEVPENQVRELRLELASAGLPRGGGVGFESFDKMRLGATEFEQRVLFRRALEGELSRTIATLGAVQSARIHLVLPEKSVFIAKNEPASASIVVRLHPGRTLGASEISGVVHLVASSVPGLSPDHITLVTTDGTMLHRPRNSQDDASEGMEDERSSRTHALEAGLEERARAMLEKVVGPGHVDVRVTADLDPARVERVEDRYDPKQSSLRSEEQSIEKMAQTDDTAAGVPGAESNLPGGAGKQVPKPDAPPVPLKTGGASDLPAGAIRESHTRNFEIDHVSEKRTIAGGALRRMTVAVILDGVQAPGSKNISPRSKEEIEKLTGLVRSAVGADEKRGDMVTVESVPFLAPENEASPEPLRKIPLYKDWKKIVPVAVALVLLAAIWVIRRRRRALSQKDEVLQLPPVSVPAKLEAPMSPEELKKLVREQATIDPASAALVVKFWLGNEEASQRIPSGPATQKSPAELQRGAA